MFLKSLLKKYIYGGFSNGTYFEEVLEATLVPLCALNLHTQHVTESSPKYEIIVKQGSDVWAFSR